jgi:SAM-dependent methyltransferase
MATHVGHVVALDAAPAMLKLAQTLANENGATNVSFVLGNANALPFAADSFDLISSQSVLQFVDLARALPAIRFSLRPGGMAAISHRAVAKGRPAIRLQEGIRHIISTLRSSIKLAFVQGPRAGTQYLRARLRHRLFSWRFDEIRLDVRKATALYHTHLAHCTVATKPGSRLLLVRWRKPRQ